MILAHMSLGEAELLACVSCNKRQSVCMCLYVCVCVCMCMCAHICDVFVHDASHGG